MEGLQKRVAGDWMDITQAALNITQLRDYFQLTAEELQRHADGLRYAVERGVTEYKQKLLVPFFSALDEMRFKSVGVEELHDKHRDMLALTFITLIQRLFASGTIALSIAKEAGAGAGKDTDIKLIIADILARIRENPEFKNVPEVKMILTQIAIYQKERETMKKLSPNIKDKQKAESFHRNFRLTFANIFESIQKYYALLVNQESREAQKKQKRKLLLNLQLKLLIPFLTRQAREFAHLASTLAFTLEEKYKTREALVYLARQKDMVLLQVDKELDEYRKMCLHYHPQNAEAEKIDVSLAFALEAAILMDSLTDKGKPQPEPAE